MKRIASEDPNQLCYRRGTGYFGLLGLPFLLFGIAAIAFCGFALKAFGIWGLLTGLVMGGPFLLLGTAIVGWRAEFLFDRVGGTLTRSWGVLVPMRRKRFELKLFQSIAIKPEKRGGRFAGRRDASTWVAYALRLVGPTASEHLFESTILGEPRRVGEEISAFLNLPLADATGEPPSAP